MRNLRSDLPAKQHHQRSVYVTNDLWEESRRRARQQGLTISAYVTLLLEIELSLSNVGRKVK